MAEALAVLGADFAPLVFGPGSLAEVAVRIASTVPGEQPMLGRIDRLVVTPTPLLVVDFKSDADPPATPEAVPAPYLAQLAAYRRAVGEIWSGRRVEAALLWTAGPTLMPLRTAKLDAAFDAGADEAP